ncbi:vesicular glutamate transporter 3-like [Nilaparvata lugens]|uniref:vesicular glutamate transporter 3-like n=1 Tax=Nilaparvata lugens TaxID=108931 RepID=UPI00193EA57F|nr:vesicular glutamate transporter 3-like [Nilaparvata lugens]
MALIFHGFMDVNFTSETVMEEKALVRFYYGYLFLQIPFGRLAEMFGGKTLIVYDSPLTHPSITRKERNYIVLKKESQGTIYKSIGCPWFEIGFDPMFGLYLLTYMFWIGAIFLTTRCSTYLSEAFQLNPLKDPFLMITPFFLSFTVAFLSGFLFDFLYDLGVPLTVLQKMFTAIATFLPAMALVGFISCQSSMSCTLFFYMIGIIFLPLAVGGYYTTFLDKSPNYAATLTAISATLANIGLVVISGVMKNLDIGLNRQQQWENRHSLISALLFTAGTIFALFGNNKEADWNTPYEYEAV